MVGSPTGPGGLLGIGSGLLMLILGRFSMGAEDVTIAFRPSFDLSLIGAAVSLSIGFLAAIVPGWQASQTEIVTALGRNEYALFGGNRLDNDECRIVSFE